MRYNIAEEDKNIIKLALLEDIGSGDITTEAICPRLPINAKIIAKEEGIVAGIDIAIYSFLEFDQEIEVKNRIDDGCKVKYGDLILSIFGNARSILSAERTALNFLCHLSGIATITSKFAGLAYPIAIYDTRKTIPLLRNLEKYAVVVGGGYNHRMGLYDGILIKENHIRIAGSPKEAIKRVRLASPEKKIEIEAQSPRDVEEAILEKPNKIMLDNLSIDEIKEAIKIIRKKGNIDIEVSGGVSLENIKAIARLMPDVISVGEITHSAKSLDMSLEVL